MGEANQESTPAPQLFNPYQGFPENFDIKSREPDAIIQAKLAEANAEAEFLRQQRAYDASMRRKRDFFLTGVITAVLAFTLYVCLKIVNSPTASADDKKAATAAICSVLTSTMSGIGGYLAGAKASKS